MAEDTLVVYPTSPMPAIDLVLSKVKGTDVPACELINAGYHLLGYVLAQIPHDHPVVEGTGAMAAKDLETELTKLKACCASSNKTGVGADFATINWKPLAAALLQALMQWLLNG